MGRTGNQIKELEESVEDLELRIVYLEKIFAQLNRAVVVIENLIPATAKPTAMQSLIQYVIATIPKKKLDKIMGKFENSLEI